MAYILTRPMPVPELRHEQINPFFHGITIDGTNSADGRSFGARIIRTVSEDQLDICEEWLETNLLEGTRITDSIFEEEKDNHNAFHKDTGEYGAITLHHTLRGHLDFVAFSGARFTECKVGRPQEVARRLIAPWPRFTRKMTAPYSILTSRVNEGDLLIFDHTQPHMFYDVSDDRRSRAQFPIREGI